jgi:hypothetical protein
MKKAPLSCVLAVFVILQASADEIEQGNGMTIPVYLNHFFTVLDIETYKAIEASDFITKEFAPHEYRETVRGDRSYAGIYFYGKNTYFEFFDEVSRGPGSKGFSMLALGVDGQGELSALQSQLADTYPLSMRKITRGHNDAQIDWFDQANADNARGGPQIGYGAWVMEYDPSFLSSWNPGASDSEGISRAALLKRYIAVLDNAPVDPYFEDIIGLTFALDPVSLQDAVDLVRAMGYEEQRVGERYVFSGPEFELQLEPVGEGGRGVRHMKMKVRRLPETREFRLGNSTLIFNDDYTASWTF